jgi:hypothetical protein
MWRLIPFRLWFALQLTAASHHFPPARNNVRYLKAQTRPGPLSFPAAMDANCRPGHGDFTLITSDSFTTSPPSTSR